MAPSSTINLAVQPLAVLVDEIVSIRISGCVPGQRVTLRASSYDDMQEQWTSWAIFVADTSGEISLDTQKPIKGSYHSIDPRGLFWSMRPVHKKQTFPFMINTQEPIKIAITAEIDGHCIASSSIEMRFGAPDVLRVPVREEGLVGTFCCPAEAGPHPGVLLLSGSDAALCDNQAALLASHGYAVLALAYFGHEGLPDNLIDIPLEYFEVALHWLRHQNTVDEKKLAIIGLSRGGELALLLAARFPGIKAVVAASPGAHMHMGMSRNDYSRAAWTYRNEPLPHLATRMDIFLAIALLWYGLRYRALALRPLFLTTLKDYDNLTEATIPVEKIEGAVLLISGQDDLLWPSQVFSAMVMQRLASYKHPYPYKHLNYRRAGHFVCFPYGYPNLPPLVGSQRGMACGGNIHANAIAIAESWQEMLTFLQENLDAAFAPQSVNSVYG